MSRNSITQMQRDMVTRRAAIAESGLKNAVRVAEMFGVSQPTARADLRAVYGELPDARRKGSAKPKKYNKRPAIGGSAVHVNMWMLEVHHKQLQELAAKRSCSVSELLREAVQHVLDVAQRNGGAA